MTNLNVLIEVALLLPGIPMRLEVQYGESQQVVELPDQNLGEVVYPNEQPAVNEDQALEAAFTAPIGSATLDKFLEGAKDLIIVVNDGTRPTPTSRVLKTIAPHLRDIETKFIVATGMHRAPTDDEYEFIFGEMYPRIKERVIIHDSKNSETILVGKSKNGTEVRFNRAVMEADRIIVISSVEPHYFAGYTGGRKSFLPGVSAYETIEQNHKLALSIEAQALKLQGNPVHEDMEDAVDALRDKKVFSVMTVLDKNHRICFAAAGDLKGSFLEAVKKADGVFVVELKQRADVVVAVTAFPYDVDLYQSQKSLDNAKYAVKDGGVIILVSACREGIGPGTFLELLGSASTPQEALKKISEAYKLGYHKAAKMAEIGLKCRMMAVTGLEDEVARRAHLEPKGSLQEAVADAIEDLGPDSKVTFIMDATITVPKVP